MEARRWRGTAIHRHEYSTIASGVDVQEQGAARAPHPRLHGSLSGRHHSGPASLVSASRNPLYIITDVVIQTAAKRRQAARQRRPAARQGRALRHETRGATHRYQAELPLDAAAKGSVLLAPVLLACQLDGNFLFLSPTAAHGQGRYTGGARSRGRPTRRPQHGARRLLLTGAPGV